MLDASLEPFARHRPHARLEVDFAPARAHYLIEATGREPQHFHTQTKRIAVTFAGFPVCRDLAVGERAGARLRRRYQQARIDVERRTDGDDVALARPQEDVFDELEIAFRHSRGARVETALNQPDHVGLGDAADGPRAPGWNKNPLDESPRVLFGSLPGQVAAAGLLGHLGEGLVPRGRGLSRGVMLGGRDLRPGSSPRFRARAQSSANSRTSTSEVVMGASAIRVGDAFPGNRS